MLQRILAAATLAALLSACGGGGTSADTTSAASAAPAPATAVTASAPAASPPPPSSSPSAPTASSAPPSPSPVATAAPASTPSKGLVTYSAVDVNTLTAGMQTVRSVDPLAGGGYAVAWASVDSAGAGSLFVQRFDAQGAKAGGEARLAYGFTAPDNPAIAVLRDGTVLVASVASSPQWTVSVQRFDAGGTALDGGTVIASQAADPAGATVRHSLAQPVLAALDDGGFAAGWASVQDDGSGAVFAQHAQRFDASVHAVGSPVDFAAAGPDRNLSLRLVAAPGGNFIAGTTHRFQGIGYVQFRFGATVVGPLDDADAGLLELNTTLLPLADGRFALWSTGISTGGYLRMLDAAGRALGAATSVAVLPETATTLPDGGWATITRQMPGQPFLAQRFDAAGQPGGAPVQLATGVSRPLGASVVSGGFAFAWTAPSAQGDTDVKTQAVAAP